MKARPVFSHKGDFGYLLIVGGSDVYSGAPALAGMAALRTGAGLVVIAAPKVIAPTIRSYSPNVIVYSLDSDVVTSDDVPKVTQLIGRSNALVLGPGIGLDPKTRRAIPMIIDIAIEMNKPMLIDADAIKALAGQIELLKGANATVTPHAGEFHVISGIDVPPGWRERLPICTGFATKYSCVLLLKGHDTIVTDGHRVRINKTGNPGMATGGMGDVLSGIIGTFLANGAEPFFAAAAGAFVHGIAGDLVRREKGFHMVASDLIEALSSTLRAYDRVRRA
jgi:NAD(P)H-hydrate epimerase